MRPVLTPTWRKSSYSEGAGAQCVEAAALADEVGVRDSKDTHRGHLTLSPTAWDTFTRALHGA